MPSVGDIPILIPEDDRILRIVERVRVNLNKALAESIVKAFEENPTADFEHVLESALVSYRKRWANAKDTAEAKKQATVILHPSKPLPERPRFPLSHSVPTVTWPLDPALVDVMGLTDAALRSGDTSIFFSRVNEGKLLFSLNARAIVRVSELIVVKISPHLSTEESAALSYLTSFPSIPSPLPLGQVTIGTTSYMFSTFVHGNSLATSWSGLSLSHKQLICAEINTVMSKLRGLPWNRSSLLGTLSSPHVCKDQQIRTLVSPPDIRSVTEFHDWNVSVVHQGISPGYCRWLRSRFRDDYSVVLTHGDLHPRNIMVVTQSDGSVKLSAIVDWEMCGWYPEYWEFYKAHNTRSVREEDDWWDMLPECIPRYDCELVTHRLLEQAQPQ